MEWVQLKNCGLKSTGNVNKPQSFFVIPPESQVQKLLEWLPPSHSRNFDLETEKLLVTTQGVLRAPGDHLILKLDGSPSDYSTRDSRGKKHLLGAVLNQSFTIILCLLNNHKVGLYSFQCETDPLLNKGGGLSGTPTVDHDRSGHQ
jgi:hypothetical protein